MAPLRFRLFGFQVQVGPMFLVLLGVFGLSRIDRGFSIIAAWWAALFVGVLVHELGHALTARAFGLQVGAIELTGIGGQVTHARTTPGRQLAISLAGPGAGFLLAVPVVLVAMFVPVSDTVYAHLIDPVVEVCVLYGVLNLLPLYPLDGGNALLAALQLVLKSRATAEKAVGMVGMALGALLIVWALTPAGPGIFFAFLGFVAMQMNLTLLQRHGVVGGF
jgi:membrane-associated protease RseP (regulator of RpoE activity)